MILLPLEAAIVVLAVDFVSGLVHWAEDTFWTEGTRLVGAWIVKPNVLHHLDGGAFTRNNWFQSSWDLLMVGVLILAGAALLNSLSWHVWLFVIVGANANQIHKWSHMGMKAPAAVRVLQRIRLLQSPGHHAGHHSGDKNISYCVITDALNPMLDRAGFWRGLDSLLVPVWGTSRRPDIRA